MAFPIDEKGMFNIFTDFEFVKPHKGALVFLDCERLLVQYEAKTGPLSPGFIVPLRTEPGETYVLETRGFLHEGKKAFIYGEARGLTGGTGSTGTSIGTTAVTGPGEFDQADEGSIDGVDAFGNTPNQVPTILGFLKPSNRAIIPNTPNIQANTPIMRNAQANSREFLRTVKDIPIVTSEPQTTTTITGNLFRAAKSNQISLDKEITGSTGASEVCNTRLIPRDFFFKSCEESCFKICFTAKTHCTDVGILFFCNTVDYCLSLSQFLIYKQSGKPGCCQERHGTCCNNQGHTGSCGSCKDHDKNSKDPCSPCSPLNSCNGNFMRFNDCCKENICIRTGPTGAQGEQGLTGAPGTSGTRTFCLDIARQGFAGRTLTTLNCSILGAFFLETGISPSTIADAIAKGRTVFSNCVKLWACDGSLFQWITPNPTDFVYYDTDALLLWIVQNQNATLLIAGLGDLAVNSSTGDVLIGNSLGQWIFDGCNLRGPTGPPGPAGATGTTGSQGIRGITGATGSPIGSATFIQNILPADFVLIPNSQGSLINFVEIALNGSSIPTGTVTTSTFVGPAANTNERRIEIETSIANILFASSASAGSQVGSGQHISGVLTIDLSTYLLNRGFIPNFIGNPTIQAQVQQDDIAINVGYPNNVYASLANGQNQVRLVIVYYNAGPNTVDLLSFQILLNLSVKICGKVALSV